MSSSSSFAFDPQKISPRQASASRTSLKTKYLITYNLVSAALWLVVLHKTLSTSLVQAKPSELYHVAGTFVRWTQTLALLELAHAVTGVVRAPLGTTALQLASRMVLVWFVVERFPVGRHWAYTSMLVAWSITEVARYTYFVFSLAGQLPPALVWLRYNLFFVMYPLGIGSENMLVVKAMRPAKESSEALFWVLVVIVGIYIPGLCIGQGLRRIGLIDDRELCTVYAHDDAEETDHPREAKSKRLDATGCCGHGVKEELRFAYREFSDCSEYGVPPYGVSKASGICT